MKTSLRQSKLLRQQTTFPKKIKLKIKLEQENDKALKQTLFLLLFLKYIKRVVTLNEAAIFVGCE